MNTSMLERLLSAAEANGTELNPTCMRVEFELPSINVHQQIFKNTRVSGWLLHLIDKTSALSRTYQSTHKHIQR